MIRKMALINDLTGFGHCSLSVVLPVVSVMGIQGCPLPTAIFSSHLGFPHWYKTDYTPFLSSYLSSWKQLSLAFDGIFCGFLGNEQQIEIIHGFLKEQQDLCKSRILIDPVMGDHGQLYSSISPSYPEKLKLLLGNAHILTPNLTEACLLTDREYPAHFPTEDFLQDICAKLHALGPEKIVITGIYQNNSYYNFVSEKDKPSCFCITKAGGSSRPGCGDLFAAILSAHMMYDIPFFDSVKTASEFVRTCTLHSEQAKIPVIEGIVFETHLSKLAEGLQLNI